MSAVAEPRAASACTACPSSCDPRGNVTRLGVKADGWDFVVALAGNPNTGKSTVFNALTGLRQHVGNWTGKTVTRAEGAFRYDGSKFKIVDLPGTYSLLSTSADEEVARNFVLFGRPDVTVVVLDATCLERNLGLCLQVLEITDRAVVALNLMDEAARAGLTIDARSLARDLGVPVVPMSARRGEGIDELLSAVTAVARGTYRTRPRQISLRDRALSAAVETLVRDLDALFPGLPNARWVAMRLLEGDESVTSAVRDGTFAELAASAPVADLPMLVRLEVA